MPRKIERFVRTCDRGDFPSRIHNFTCNPLHKKDDIAAAATCLLAVSAAAAAAAFRAISVVPSSKSIKVVLTLISNLYDNVPRSPLRFCSTVFVIFLIVLVFLGGRPPTLMFCLTGGRARRECCHVKCGG